MDLSLLDTLKQKLVTASSFAEVAEYFMDHFGENEEFLDCGVRTESPLLESVISQIAKQLFSREVVPNGLLLVRVPGTSFIHGGFLLEGKVGSVIHFEDAHIGLVSIVWSFNTNETKYARFSTQVIPRQGGNFSRN